MNNSTKYLGWASLILGAAYFVKSRSEDEAINFEGFDLNIDADKILNNGLDQLNISERNKDILYNLSKKGLNRYLED